MEESQLQAKPSRKFIYLFILAVIIVSAISVTSNNLALQFLMLQVMLAPLVTPVWMNITRAAQNAEIGKIEAGFSLSITLGAIFFLFFTNSGLTQSIYYFFELEVQTPVSNILKVLFAAELVLLYAAIYFGLYLITSNKWIFRTGVPYKEQYWAAVGKREKRKLQKLADEKQKRHLLPISFGALFVWFLLFILAGVLVFWFYINTFAFK